MLVRGDGAAAAPTGTAAASSTGRAGAIAYQHLFWFYGHPVVYVMFFPFVGAVAEVVATFARRRFFGYRAFVVSLLAFAALSMSVWAHHMFTTGGVTNQYFALTSTLLVVPAGIEYFDLLGDADRRARSVLRTPMLFALGVLRAVPDRRADRDLRRLAAARLPRATTRYFVVAHFHYTLFAGSVFGLLRRRLLLVPEGRPARCCAKGSAGSTSGCWSSART